MAFLNATPTEAIQTQVAEAGDWIKKVFWILLVVFVLWLVIMALGKF